MSKEQDVTEALELIEWLKSDTPKDEGLYFLLQMLQRLVQKRGATFGDLDVLRTAVAERKEAMGQ